MRKRIHPIKPTWQIKAGKIRREIKDYNKWHSTDFITLSIGEIRDMLLVERQIAKITTQGIIQRTNALKFKQESQLTA